MELLTQATVVVELLGAGYIASSFATYAHRRINYPTSWKSRSISKPVPETFPQTSKSSPPKRKPTPVELLRQQCQKEGIKWRNAHGKNKHLKKAEMIAALKQLERTKTEPTKRVVESESTKPVVAGKRAA